LQALIENSGSTGFHRHPQGAALEAKNLKEAPTVSNGFLNLTHPALVRIFLFKTVPFS